MPRRSHLEAFRGSPQLIGPMLAFDELVSNVLLARKPPGPLYHGWHGQALRVPPEEYERRVERSREAMRQVRRRFRARTVQELMDFLVLVQPEELEIGPRVVRNRGRLLPERLLYHWRRSPTSPGAAGAGPALLRGALDRVRPGAQALLGLGGRLRSFERP